jgi:hypothetical protein
MMKSKLCFCGPQPSYILIFTVFLLWNGYYKNTVPVNNQFNKSLLVIDIDCVGIMQTLLHLMLVCMLCVYIMSKHYLNVTVLTEYNNIDIRFFISKTITYSQYKHGYYNYCISFIADYITINNNQSDKQL